MLIFSINVVLWSGRVMIKLSINLASEKDIKDIFDLSNDSIVRQYSIHTNQINWDDHIAWFSNKIKAQDCIFFVIRDEQNNFVGQVRFDCDSKNFMTCIVSISVSKDFRSKGLGKIILNRASIKLFSDFDFDRIIAYIKKDNQPSINLFSKVGYNLVGQESINSIEFLKFELCKMKE
jgi:RimJ/RimL family protein N-acetyltransferase